MITPCKTAKTRLSRSSNNPKGEFVRGDLYIFAYDFLGNALCLPFQPDFVGTNRLNATDANGITFTRDNLELAGTGSGQTYYLYPEPQKKYERRAEAELHHEGG